METISYAQIFISALFKKSVSCHKSSQSLQNYPARSSQIKTYLQTRKNYIKQLEDISTALDLSSSTLHLSIKYFDTLNLSSCYPEALKSKLLLICLNLAIKFNEDLIELHFSDLQDLSPSLSQSEFINLEFLVLDKLKWKLHKSTTHDQIHEICSKFFNSSKILTHSLSLSDLTLRIDEFSNEDPKTLACTCIAFTLKKLGNSSYWPNHVELYTRVSKKSLKISELEKKFNEVVLKHN